MDHFGAILVAAPGGAVDEDDAFGDFDAFAGDAAAVSPGFADAFGGEALCAGEAASGEGAGKGGGTHGVARMGCENNPERLHQVDGPIDFPGSGYPATCPSPRSDGIHHTRTRAHTHTPP